MVKKKNDQSDKGASKTFSSSLKIASSGAGIGAAIGGPVGAVLGAACASVVAGVVACKRGVVYSSGDAKSSPHANPPNIDINRAPDSSPKPGR